MSYRQLDPKQILETADRLNDRIERRFPDSGLGHVCQEVHSIAEVAGERSIEFGKPILWLRYTLGLFVALLLVLLVLTCFTFKLPDEEMKLDHFVEVLEPGAQVLVMIGIGIFFGITLEARIKRNQTLIALHQLRSIAHIIDMHQLTKDPDRAKPPIISIDGESPPDHLTAKQLTHYLDYCSEMLSILGKIAALYVQRFNDPQALAAVNEMESLTTGLSRKIWQKIMILNTIALEQDIPWLDSDNDKK